MANTRDLRVNIDGDPSGVDHAFLSAAESAKVFDRELEKLERQQRLQEEALKRAESATKAYGRANSDAGEKAIKLGHAAQEAGDKAARSMALAHEAADKLAKGEITAKEAAELEAKALRDVERAAIAAAAAQRASAKAADDQAKQEKQAARDAVVAAATQRLEHLRAAGAVKEHNALLTKLRKDYKEFDKGFDEMKTAASTAFTFLRNGMSALGSGAANLAQSLGPGMVAVILGALAVLPAAATLIGGGIVLGLGGAFTAMGLDATKGSALAQKALGDLRAHAVSVLSDITRPWERTWVALASSAKTLLDGIAPDLSALFKSMAPQVSSFFNQIGRDLPSKLHGLFVALQQDFGPIISELGATLPQALGLAADGLKQVMDEVSRNPQEFGNMIVSTGRLVQALGTVTVWMIKIGEAFTRANAMTGEWGARLQNLAARMGPFGAVLNTIGSLMERFDLTSHQTTSDLASFGFGLTSAATQALTAADAVSHFDDAVTKIVDPSLAAYEANLKLGDSFANLASALKTSHGQMGRQTAASRAAGEAFAATMHQVLETAKAQEKLTGDSKAGQAVIQQNIGKLWALAGSNQAAQQQVIRLAAAFGVTLPRSAQTAKSKVDGVHKALDGIRNKTVTVTADTSQAYNAARNLQNFINSIFGHAYGGPIGHVPGYPGFAAGGPVRGFPSGGKVSGPGTATSDSIMTRLSNGEFVINARATAQWLPLLTAINSNRLSPGKDAYLPAAHQAYLPAVHQAYLPSGLGGATSGDRLSAVHVSKLTAGKTAVLPAALHPGTAGSGGASAARVDVYLHITGSGRGVMGEIVKELKHDVRVQAGGSAQVFFGAN